MACKNRRPMCARAKFMAVAAAAALLCASALAAVEITVLSQGLRRVPVAVANFAGEPGGHLEFSRIIAADLHRSGLIKVTHGAPDGYAPFGKEPDYEAARQRNLEYVLAGRADTVLGGYRVYFQLYDVITEKSGDAFSLVAEQGQERLVAHLISDWVHETVNERPGVFTSKIAYVLKSSTGQDRRTYELKVADYDGYNAQTIIRSSEPIISPEWSASGDRMLYVSFERERPIIYEMDLLTGEIRVVAAFEGNNSAPALSPDRRWIAAAFSGKKGTAIYLLTTDGTRRRKLRESSSINTEPDYSPVDGSEIAYVSDEAGSPQLYAKNLDTGVERRLTRGSSYNVSPSYSPDGRLVAYIRKDDNGFNVHVLDSAVDNGATVPLTGVRAAESPSFSPDGTMVLYRNEDYPGLLYTVSINGKISIPLAFEESGEVFNPTWGPVRSSWY